MSMACHSLRQEVEALHSKLLVPLTPNHKIFIIDS